MKHKIIKIFVIFILFIAAVIAFFMSPLFNIEEIVISPMVYYKEADVHAELSDLLGKNGFSEIMKNKSLANSERLFSMELTEMEDKLIFECPFLRDVRIKFKLPNKIYVTTKERIPIFLAEYYSVYLYIDSEGYLLKTFTAEEEKPVLPIVQGLELEGYKVGQPITLTEDVKIDTAIKLCNMMNQLSMPEGMIDIIDLTNPSDVWFYCSPSLSVKFGESNNLGVKLSVLGEIFKSGYDGNSNGVIDFSSGGYPVFRSSN